MEIKELKDIDLNDPFYDGVCELEEEDFDEIEAAHALKWEALRAKRSQLPEVQQQAIKRWEDIEALRTHYAEFTDFMYDVITELMGFTCTDIQLDIGEFLQYGDKYSMIQAQRSQAKSTIVAIFAVWVMIHNPKTRVLIVSAGSDVAMEIANWVIQIIMNWDILECMRPDRQHGDRASAKAFDIHWQLKGVEKSPSIACIGVTANMQGRRADILIPDDIESSKNGLTETQRQNLIHLSRDFTSICQKGRIIYLGTPQTSDSIYNTLPGRGFTIRIWPGRYPNKEEIGHYGDHLAPLITQRIAADPALQIGHGVTGESGAAIDPALLPEELLVAKELDQGSPYFQLQHMLNTELSDKDRYPLNTRNIMWTPLNTEKCVGEFTWMPDPNKRIIAKGFAKEIEFYMPFTMGAELFDYEGRYMYVDTAGGGTNGDETVAWAIYFIHGYVIGMEMLALKGGISPENFDKLSAFAWKHQVNEIGVEQNHGYGAYAQAWRPVLLKYYEDKDSRPPTIDDDWVSVQKELRIIDTLEPLIGRHRLIINSDVLLYDWESVQQYPMEQRVIYTLVNQINKITRDRGALVHDDRLDSLAGGVRRFVDRMAVDEQKRIEAKKADENLNMMGEWSEEFKTSLKGLAQNFFNRTKGNK